ncbi:hypothetical protein [Paenibacillus sp. DYY-L-2]|uniref:hypothetical protein n=1 Tax=Paenibacillus sp. DYY-L-2 TaxID=3447013 RepID=UPI003F4F5469
MIPAKIHELKKTFFCHSSVYKSATEIRVSHKLLLFYAVECGLKVLLLKKIRKTTTEAFLEHSELKVRMSGKNGHNIKYMLQFLGYSHFSLPNMECLNEKQASPSEYNQVWRYGIQNSQERDNEIEQTLVEIVEWIEGRI